MSPLLNDNNNGPVVKFVGSPNEPSRPDEMTRWKRYLQVLWPWAKKTGKLVNRAGSLADAYSSAEVRKQEGKAAKFAEEATEIAARRDQIQQETVRVVNEEIARIFADNNLPIAAKQLQLANLLASNPQIAEQLERIEGVYMRLKMEHGFHAELLPERNPIFNEKDEKQKSIE